MQFGQGRCSGGGHITLEKPTEGGGLTKQIGKFSGTDAMEMEIECERLLHRKRGERAAASEESGPVYGQGKASFQERPALLLAPHGDSGE